MEQGGVRKPRSARQVNVYQGGISAAILLLVLGLAFTISRQSFAEPEPKPAAALPPIVFVEAPVVVTGAPAGRFPRGSHLAFFSPAATSRTPVNLTPGFFAAADPQVSFNGREVLFAGRKTREGHWQIWEMNADGKGKRQITRGPADCFHPAYLPGNEIVYTRVSGRGSASAVYVAKADGSGAHPITFGPGNFRVEAVLHSGRILVSAGSRLMAGRGAGEGRLFYTLRTDGSGLSLFRWDRHAGVVQGGAVELRNGTVLFVERRDGPDRVGGGELAWFRPGALHDSVITPPGAVYWSARRLDGNWVVVSKRSSDGRGAQGTFGLYVFDLARQSPGRAIYRNRQFSSVEAVAVEPSRVPREYWSILHPKFDYGRLVCLNAYLSADVHGGRLPGKITRVRVIALEHRRQRNLGEAPVESDGSFYLKVPADRPIRFELLNAHGKVIQQQRSWIWARTGEDVGCLGCHASHALTPTNHWPLALRAPGAPFPLGVAAASHSAKH